jgi:outer membrane protein, heavy metal efflux system
MLIVIFRCYFVLQVLCLIPIGVQAENMSAPLSLSEAIQRTLQHNPELHQFRLIRQQLHGEKLISALKPSYQLNVQAENLAGTKTDSDSAEFTLALSSVIELGNKRKARLAASKAGLDAFEYEQQAVTLDVLGNLTTDFISALTTREQQKLAAEAVVFGQSLLAVVRKRAESGAASDVEVLRAKAVLAQAEIRAAQLSHKLERERLALAAYWGRTEADFGELQGNIFSFGRSQSFADLYQRIQDSPAIKILASERRLKDAEIRLMRTQDLSDLSWQFGLRRLEESDETALVLGVSLPLFTAQRNRGAVKTALATRNRLDYQHKGKRLTLHQRLFVAYSQRQEFVSAHQKLSQTVIPDLQKALSLSRSAYDLGRLRYQDWVSAQQELLQAKQHAVDAASAVLFNQALIEQLVAEPLNN